VYKPPPCISRTRVFELQKEKKKTCIQYGTIRYSSWAMTLENTTHDLTQLCLINGAGVLSWLAELLRTSKNTDLSWESPCCRHYSCAAFLFGDFLRVDLSCLDSCSSDHKQGTKRCGDSSGLARGTESHLICWTFGCTDCSWKPQVPCALERRAARGELKHWNRLCTWNSQEITVKSQM